MLFSSDDAEEFYEFENENEIVNELSKIDTKLLNNKTINNENSDNNNNDDDSEVEDGIYVKNLFDVKISYKVKRKNNDLNILKFLYEQINNN